jgi:phosphoesterase RecJ-like protein
MSLKKIAAAINKYQRFLITSHVNLDGDAICSELALAELLKLAGKNVSIINESRPPQIYRFLPKISSLSSTIKTSASFDVAILLDCTDISRIGKVASLIKKETLTIGIDHHVSNDVSLDINLVRKDASSTAELIYDIFKRLNFKFNRQLATLIYVGILTDTGSFKYSNTSDYTHKIVAELLKWKLSVNKIYRKVYEMNPASDMRLVACLCKDFKMDDTGKIVWVSIGRDVFLKNDIQIDLGEQILGFLRLIKGIKVAALFRELPHKNQIRVNLRSVEGIDVSKVAVGFAGGGHKSASGCTVEGSLREVERKVLSQLRKVVR